ncbi:hypothetical protein [Streptomyces albipurpureus]|uniref:PH domain-containing protein n=1 Tax=Streptomyces albipurpureus TaxID=2897419 RepID=A0ABT0ULH9_9ACTN|nr:hypothetical protein [Streptomyces sp. CWNU-1]MCM2389473.1 hypothetical protein [Streptomyces sp. CWNU-1]
MGQFALPLVSALLLGGLLFQVILLVTGEPVTVAGIRNHLRVIGSAALGILVLPRPEAVTATPRFLAFGKGDRGRADWTDVRDITVRRSAGIDRVRVSLRDGRSVFLRAPISLLDRQFVQKTEELQDFLQTSRLNCGADTD